MAALNLDKLPKNYSKEIEGPIEGGELFREIDDVESYKDDILSIICKNNNPITISSLIQEFRHKGWKKLGNNHDFSEDLRVLGFSLVQVYKQEFFPSGKAGAKIHKACFVTI